MRFERAERFTTIDARSASIWPSPVLAVAVASPGQRATCCFDRVGLVALAVASTLLAVRSIDFDHGHVESSEVACEADPICAGAFGYPTRSSTPKSAIHELNAA